jgi:hypothetical protein
MGNPDSSWWYERDGIMRQEASISFDAGKLRTGLEVIANNSARSSTKTTLAQRAAPDGSRLAAVIPPVVRPAPALVIRKFTSRHYTVDDLIARGTLTRPLADFLAEQIAAERPAYQRRNRDRQDDALRILGQTSFPTTNASSSSKIPRSLHIQKPNIWPSNARPTRSKPTSLSTTFEVRSPLETGPDHPRRSARNRGAHAARFLQHRPRRFARDDPCQFGGEGAAPLRQSRHAQPRADHLLRHRSRDRRSRRFRRPCRAPTRAAASSAKCWRLRGYDRDANAS